MVDAAQHPQDAQLLDTVGALAETCKERSSEAHRKEIGQFFTSPRIARFIAELPELRADTVRLRILDPGAGVGTLAVAMAERAIRETHRSVHVVAVEPDPIAKTALSQALGLAGRHLGPRFSFEVRGEDFLSLDPTMLGHPTIEPFDLVVANPPYFKVSPTEDRGGDAPNMYARFMEVAARLLAPGGQLSCIVPRSFTSGAYFERFRKRFFAAMCLERVHVFASRRDAFRDEGVLQENVIIHFRRVPNNGDQVVISSSEGESDLSTATIIRVDRAQVLPGDRHASVFFPIDASDIRTIELFRRWKHTLGSYGLDVSTGPVVPFRSEEFLRTQPVKGQTVPLLWMQHVRAGSIVWPLGDRFRKAEYIESRAGAKLLVRNSTYIIMRRFTAKEERRRLVAAVLRKNELPSSHLGFENHLNFIHALGGELEERDAVGLTALLNSELFDRYFRITSGHTQVNATELRALPLPDRDLLSKVAEQHSHRATAPSAFVEEVLGVW